MRNPLKTSQAGFGLLEALIAAGLLTMIAAGFASVMKHQISAQSRSQQRSDLTAIKSMLTERLDCAQTLKHYRDASGVIVCPTSPYGLPVIDLRDQNDRILVDGDHPDSLAQSTKVGSWTLRAMCDQSPATPGVVVQAARPKPTSSGLYDANNANFMTDPLSGVVLSWEQKPTKNFPGSDLFFANARPCAAALAPPAAAPAGWVPSPGGKCVTSRTMFNRTFNGGPTPTDAAYTSVFITCPAAFPMQTQTMVTPSGCACGWQSGPTFSGAGQVNGGSCSEMMVDQQMQYNQCGLHPSNNPPPGYTLSAWHAQIAASKACEGTSPQAQCTVTCCNL